MAFGRVLSFLEKPLQKKLRPRFSFLCDTVTECVALSPQTAEFGIQLLWDFVQTNNVKGNFRNSVNDMMILAAAISARDQLVTDDNLLFRFAAARRQAPVREVGPKMIEIDFQRENHDQKSLAKESKGYIHRGWRIAADRRRRDVPDKISL